MDSRGGETLYIIVYADGGRGTPRPWRETLSWVRIALTVTKDGYPPARPMHVLPYWSATQRKAA